MSYHRFTTIGLGAALHLQAAYAQQPNQAKGIQRPADPRVQQRTYHFKDTNEDLPYAVYVSSKVSKDRKNPLIFALHGLGGDHNNLLQPATVDLAEEGGYILVGPMGYNPRGWYGVSAGPHRTSVAPKANPAAANDPPNIRELSEKDVLNVLDIIRKEFNVDDRRTYLMGHSMGGAGTLYLGSSTHPIGPLLQPSLRLRSACRPRPPNCSLRSRILCR